MKRCESPFSAFAAIFLLFIAFAGVGAQQNEAPEKIIFESRLGAVIFDHAEHTQMAGGDCAACHPKLFPQSREPLGYAERLHQTAEANRTSCAGCHHPEGPAFGSKGSCNRCHVKG